MTQMVLECVERRRFGVETHERNANTQPAMEPPGIALRPDAPAASML